MELSFKNEAEYHEYKKQQSKMYTYLLVAPFFILLITGIILLNQATYTGVVDAIVTGNLGSGKYTIDYVVNGSRITNTFTSPTPLSIGSTITVYYNPSNPSALGNDSRGMKYAGTILTVLSIIYGIAAVVYVYRKLTRTSD